VYLGYVIGGGELKIDPTRMENIMEWSMPTSIYEVNNFKGEAQYLKKFITYFSKLTALLHAIISSGKSLNQKGLAKVL